MCSQLYVSELTFIPRKVSARVQTPNSSVCQNTIAYYMKGYKEHHLEETIIKNNISIMNINFYMN